MFNSVETTQITYIDNPPESLEVFIDENKSAITDAQSELNECISALKQLQDIVNSDKDRLYKQQKAQNILTNIFLEYMDK
ncbi:hypothetical protein CEE75_12730 [Lactobacillus crispatus]|uniref:Uncharacterized protein n=1 Tax=Lactobacillus crispatus TaxID=47770 RepID=A0A4R6CR53_9LACO|nr:hypothetical protein CEE75_12730 [Lactobacillus crispatus]